MDQQEYNCKKHDFYMQSTREAFFRTCLSCGFVEDIQISPGKQKADTWQSWLRAAPRPLTWPPCVKYTRTLQEAPSNPPTNSSTKENVWKDTDVYAYRPNLQTSFQSPPQMDRSPYMYSDLPKSSCIRLLELSPGNRLDTLSGRLFEVWWEQETCPSYSALSYTWADDKGDASPKNLIFLNEEQKVLRITRNCDRALRNLRQKHQSVLLWVDSICINQLSASERSHQVALMKTIYSKATAVHAYVGETECEKDLTGTEAMALLQDLQGDGKYSMRLSSQNRSIAILNAFFSRSYFARLWIVQELLLARSIEIHCGEASVQVSNESVSQLYEQGVKVPSWVRYVGKLQFREERPAIDLRDLLVATSLCQVTDLRDKIFGLLGLVSNAQDLSPDYELMVREVYIGVAAYLMGNHQCCDLIQLLGISSMTDKYCFGIPSWVPMWDTVTLLHASQDLCTHIKQIELDCMRLFTKERGINSFTIRTIDGWPHDEKSNCKEPGKRCKTVHSGSGFLATNIETVLRLKSDSSFQSRSIGGLEDNEYATSIYQVNGDIAVAIRTFRDLTISGTHLIRVEGCASLFLADTTSDSRQYILIGPCLAAIVCPTNEPSPVESFMFEDLHRFSHFTPLTLEMVQFMAKWRSKILIMAKSDPEERSDASSIEEQSYNYSLEDEPEISHQVWRSWGPFLAVGSGQISGVDAKLQRHLPTLAEFWGKAHELHTRVRQWTASALGVRRQRSFIQVVYKNLYKLRNALYDYSEESKKLFKDFETITGCCYILQSFQPAERLLKALQSNEVEWVDDDLLGYAGGRFGLTSDVDDLIGLLDRDRLFLDKAFPWELSSIHPKYNIIKETLEWKKALSVLGKTDKEARYVSFI